MNWISVEDALPSIEDGGPYSRSVMITDGKEISIGYYQREEYAEEGHSYSSDVWWDEADRLSTNCCGWAEPTHWRELHKEYLKK